MKLDKDKMIGSNGAAITQSLFLEIGYKTNFAMFTLKDYDIEYKGNKYISLKKLFLAMEDVTEYEFANEYLLGWTHWQRIAENAQVKPYVDKWREELEIKIRAQAIRDIISMTAEGGSFQAAKWLADKGWDKKAAGRPKKEDKLKEAAQMQRIASEFEEDFARLREH